MADPDPDLLAEAAALLARLEPLATRTEDGKGATVSLTVTIPVENATLAAWLMTKQAMRCGHGLARDLRDMPLVTGPDDEDNADCNRARHYIEAVALFSVMREWRKLREGEHQQLLPIRAEAIDDDIPF